MSIPKMIGECCDWECLEKGDDICQEDLRKYWEERDKREEEK